MDNYFFIRPRKSSQITQTNADVFFPAGMSHSSVWYVIIVRSHV